MTGRAPLRQLRQGVAQDLATELDQEARLLGERQELAGRQQTALGVQPARQYLVAEHATGFEIDDRLEVRHDLAALDTAPQFTGRAQCLHT